MIKRNVWLPVTALWSALAVILIMGQGIASAANPNGLRVSPVRTDLTISPGTSQVVQINVTNVTAGPASYQGIVNDFTANSDESGNPVLILGTNQYAPSHSLKRFVQPIANFTLGPGQETSVPVTISVPQNAAGGGYYGVVRFAPASEEAGNQNVTLSGSVGSLILVTVPGNIIDKVTIAGFASAKNGNESAFFTTNKNLQAIVRFENEGNIQEEPFGKILVKNRSGKTLSTVEVNNTQPPGNVLPDSIRKFNVPLSGVGAFGIYKLEGNFGYGSNGQLLSASTTFYVVPIAAIVIFIVVVVVLLFFIFVFPRLVQAYNQRVIRRARGSRR